MQERVYPAIFFDATSTEIAGETRSYVTRYGYVRQFFYLAAEYAEDVEMLLVKHMRPARHMNTFPKRIDSRTHWLMVNSIPTAPKSRCCALKASPIG